MNYPYKDQQGFFKKCNFILYFNYRLIFTHTFICTKVCSKPNSKQCMNCMEYDIKLMQVLRYILCNNLAALQRINETIYACDKEFSGTIIFRTRRS